MGVGLQDKLNKFQFERTVDWRIRFETLDFEIKAMGIDNPAAARIAEKLGTILYDGYLFAQSCEFTPGMVTYKQDQQIGYYNSSLSFPSLQFTLYLDAHMVIEQALQIWCMSGYMADGTMPINLNAEAICKYQVVNPVQRIRVQRISPFKVKRAFLGLLYDVPGQGAIGGMGSTGSSVADALDRNKIRYNESVLEWYTFDAYLQAEPKYSGTSDSTGFRTASLICNVAGFERGHPLTVGADESDRRQTAEDRRRGMMRQALKSNPDLDKETLMEALAGEEGAAATVSAPNTNYPWMIGR